LVCQRLVFFRLAGPFITRFPGGPTVSIDFWSNFSSVDINRDFAACLIFLPCTTSPAIFNPVFKASRSRVFVPFFHDYYIHQAGKRYPVFAGRRYQRGHGLGSIFGGLFKAAMPLLKKGTKTLEREALKTGLNIAGDVVQGRNIKQAAKSRLISTEEKLLQLP
jgi:hypothetical protein